jgi:hypothetical protein
MATVSEEREPLVLQLQRAAMNGEIASSVLKKAKVVGSKLGMANTEFLNWIDDELNGYAESGRQLPNHRVLGVQPRAFNPLRGDIPVFIEQNNSPALLQALYELPIPNPLSELEGLLAAEGDGSIYSPFPPELQNLVSELTGLRLQYRHKLSRTQLRAIPEAATQRTLNWALELERGGVFGEGFTFTLSERATAMSITNNFTNSNVGTVGDVSGQARVTNIQNAVSNGPSSDELADLAVQLRTILEGLPLEAREAISTPLAVLEEQADNDEPDTSKIRSALLSIRTVCEGAVGNLVASGVLSVIGKWL